MTKYKQMVSSRLYGRLVKYDLFKKIGTTDLKTMLNCIGARFIKYDKNVFLPIDSRDVSNTGLILEGSIAAIKEDEQGHQNIVLYMGEGVIFGETPSLSKEHTAKKRFKTITECTILYLSFRKILNICDNNCPFHKQLVINLFDCLSKENSCLVRKIEVLSGTTIREKILIYLKEEIETANKNQKKSGARKITLPINRSEMAQYLCVNRSALVRELTSMKRDGLIDVKGNTFTLL